MKQKLPFFQMQINRKQQSHQQYVHQDDRQINANQMHHYEYSQNQTYKQDNQQSYIPSQYQGYQQSAVNYSYSNSNAVNYPTNHMNGYTYGPYSNYGYVPQYAYNLDQDDTQQDYVQSNIQGSLKNSSKMYPTNVINHREINTNDIFVKQMKLICQMIIDQNQETIEELTGQNAKIMSQYKLFKKLILSGKFKKEPLNHIQLQKMYENGIRSNQTYQNQLYRSPNSYFPQTIPMQKDLQSLKMNEIKSSLNPNYGLQKNKQIGKSQNSQFQEKMFDLKTRGKQTQIQQNERTIQRLLEKNKKKSIQSASDEQSYLIEGQQDVFNLNQDLDSKSKNEIIKDKQRILQHQKNLIQQKNCIVQFLKQFLSDFLQYAPQNDFYDRKLSKKQIMLIYTQWRKVDFLQKYRNGGLNPSSVQMELTRAFKRTFANCLTQKYHFVGIQYIGEYMTQDILNLIKKRKIH